MIERIGVLIKGSLMVLVLTISCPLMANDTEKLLVQAESLSFKSVDQLADFVVRLEAHDALLSPVQRQRLTLLKAHQLALSGAFNSAIAQLEELLMETLHPRQRSRALYLLAHIADTQQHYEDAFIYLNRAIQLPIQEPSVQSRYEPLLLASQLIARAGDFKRALGYGRQVLEIARTGGEPSLMCVALQNIGLIHSMADEPKLAQRAVSQQIDYCTQHAEVLVVAEGELRMGLLSQNKGQHNQAITYLHKALSKFIELEHPKGIIDSRVALADSWHQLGDIDHAEKLLALVLSSEQTGQQWRELHKAYQLSAEIAAARGHYQQATAFYQQYIDASDRITDNQGLRLGYLQLQFQMEQRKLELASDETQRQYYQLMSTSNYQQLWIIALGCSLLLSLGLSVMLYFGRLRRQHQHYRDQTQLDPLTGVYNRKYSYELAFEMYKQSRLDHSPFVVVKADIDRFKQVNEHHGYDIGDIALQALAGRLQQATRDGDVLGRVGGDEFILFFSNITLYQVLNIVKRCQSMLSELIIDNREVKMTVSFGLAEAEAAPTPGAMEHDLRDELAALVQHASLALASAPEGDGSGVMLYGDQPFHSAPQDTQGPVSQNKPKLLISDKNPLGV